VDEIICFTNVVFNYSILSMAWYVNTLLFVSNRA